MEIQVRNVGVVRSAALDAYACRRVRGALTRVLEPTSMVIVRMVDVNGPRGGLDKRCKVEVRGPHARAIVETTDSDAYAAVDLACARVSEVLRRRRERSRRTWRARTSAGHRLRRLAGDDGVWRVDLAKVPPAEV